MGDSAYDFYGGAERESIDVNYIDDSLSQGRVEICIHGSYGSVCANSGHGWSNEDAAVVCNELGFTKFGTYIMQKKLYVVNYYLLYLRCRRYCC